MTFEILKQNKLFLLFNAVDANLKLKCICDSVNISQLEHSTYYVHTS